MIQKKITYFLFFILIISSQSCSLESGWSEKEKKSFLLSCTGDLKTTLNVDRCNCILNGIMSEYNSPREYRKKKRKGKLSRELRIKLNKCDH